MKKLIYTALFIAPLFAFSQKELSVSEEEKEMSLGVKPCYVVEIPASKLKTIQEGFKKYIKKDAKGKMNDDKGEINMIGAMNKNISSLPFNAFGRFVESSNGVKVSFWASEGEIFISSKTAPDKSEAAKKYIKDFAIAQYKEVYETMVETEKDKLKDVTKLLEGFDKDQKKAEEKIASQKREIEKLNQSIKDEEKNIEAAKSNQAKQKNEVEKQAATLKNKQSELQNIK